MSLFMGATKSRDLSDRHYFDPAEGPLRMSGITPTPISATGEVCQKCSSTGQCYHDYDPRRRHNGLTCLTCGFEQELTSGGKSLIHTAGR